LLSQLCELNWCRHCRRRQYKIVIIRSAYLHGWSVGQDINIQDREKGGGRCVLDIFIFIFIFIYFYILKSEQRRNIIYNIAIQYCNTVETYINYFNFYK
jgi:hypothetical protein